MSIITVTKDIWQFNRERTLSVLDQVGEQPDPAAVLGWRPGDGRAHIAWQLMHIGITEELFATERIVGTPPAYADLVPRFRGGSTPDEHIPSVGQIREVLDTSRAHLLSTIDSVSEADLGTVPEPFRERGWTLGKILQVIAWHEPHHQGQAHITLNLWKASQG